MPRRHRDRYPRSVWNAGTLVNIFSIPLLSAGVFLIGQYFLWGDELKRHDDAIKMEFANREKDKAEFATRFDKMGESLSSLDKHAAVQDETLKTISSQLGAYLDQNRR